MTEVHIDVAIADDGWKKALIEAEDLCRAAACAAARTATGKDAPSSEVSILLTDDAQIQELNRQYRSKDEPTNVLSFANLDGEDTIGQGPAMLGDIVVALGVAGREAKDENKTLADHLTHLVIHGMMHLLGFDHENDEEAHRMEALEIQTLAELGVADPYHAADQTEI